MQELAPPLAWLDGGGQQQQQPLPAQVASDGSQDAADLKQVATAWKHIRTVASKDDGRTPDLYDLLSHSVRETQYSFQPQGVSPGGGAGSMQRPDAPSWEEVE